MIVQAVEILGNEVDVTVIAGHFSGQFGQIFHQLLDVGGILLDQFIQRDDLAGVTCLSMKYAV